MKFRRFAVCAGLCTASVFMTLTSAAVTAADDTYKTTVKGKAGQNQLERITDAELPEITGNATYSAYIPLAQTKTVEYFVLDIDGLNNTVYEHLAVTVDKVRIDGEEYEMNSTPAVDIQYEEGSFNGTRIYIANEDSNYPFLPVQTKVNESIEIIFTVKGMPTDGPLFVDKQRLPLLLRQRKQAVRNWLHMKAPLRRRLLHQRLYRNHLHQSAIMYCLTIRRL